MNIIKPSFKIYEQAPSIEGIYEAIERAGRTCYKSVRPKDQTAKDFVDKMIASRHYAMLEHGTVYLTILGIAKPFVEPSNIGKYLENPYSKVVFGGDTTFYITTNYRVIVENNWLDDLKYLCEPTEYHERRVTVRFITDRGVSHEFVRHRVFSFAQESTRYCNYSKDKFGNELTFIYPSWSIDVKSNKDQEANSSTFPLSNIDLLYNIEAQYNHLINDHGWKPQQARMILPNCIKTELIMTGFVSDWDHFFDLRARGTTGTPHPDAKYLAEPLMNEFISRGYIKE